jgi:asparagine synthase (glutamine-hydrolysing)
MNINLQRILLKVDRSGMYNSIEVRVPYLSNKVIDAALRQCWTNHIHNGNGKFFLKQVLSKKIDHQYAFKSKKGFLVPMRNWLRESIKHDVYEKILNMPAELRVAFNQKNLQKLLDRHIVEQRDYSGIIWAVYALVNWHHYHRNAKALVP